MQIVTKLVLLQNNDAILKNKGGQSHPQLQSKESRMCSSKKITRETL